MRSTTAKDDSELFGSRLAFYFAAVGSAVGFGNVWRFPDLAYRYGGGAFFIPYLLALFLIGLPVIFLEISLGQFYQTGDVGVFGSIHKRLRGVGLASVTCAFILTGYYSALIAWVVRAFFDSWSSSAPWGKEGVTSSEAVDYFWGSIVEVGDPGHATKLIGANVGYTALVWVIMYFCIAFGLKVTGKITYATMGLPILIIFIFLFKGITLTGSSDGIKEYIGRWDTTVIREDGGVWSEAVSQIFFSLSVTFGCMTAYGAHLRRDKKTFVNTCIVAAANSFYSFISGFAVFAAIGHAAYLEGVPVGGLENISGFGLVFGTWPVVFSKLPGGEHWVRLLFFTLFLLGIDSGFSIVEGVLTVLRDTTFLKDVPRWKLCAWCCLVSYLIAFSVYCTDIGLFMLDTMDFYINFVMIIIGFFETFSVGWIYGIEEQISKFGASATIAYLFANFGSVIVACGLWFGLDNHAIWSGFVALVVVYAIGFYMTTRYIVLHVGENNYSSSTLYDFMFGNIFAYKATLEPVIGYIPSAWCYLVKQLIPHVLVIIFVNLARSKNDAGESKFGHYGGYDAWPYQVLGCLSFFLALTVISGAFFVPEWYAKFILPTAAEKEDDDLSYDKVDKADDEEEEVA